MKQMLVGKQTKKNHTENSKVAKKKWGRPPASSNNFQQPKPGALGGGRGH